MKPILREMFYSTEDGKEYGKENFKSIIEKLKSIPIESNNTRRIMEDLGINISSFFGGFYGGWGFGLRLRNILFGMLFGIILGSLLTGGYIFNNYSTRVYTIPVIGKDMKHYDMKFVAYKGKIHMVIEKELP